MGSENVAYYDKELADWWKNIIQELLVPRNKIMFLSLDIKVGLEKQFFKM